MTEHKNALFLRYLEATGYSLDEVIEFQWHCYPNAKFFNCMTPWGTASLIADIARGIFYEIHVVREETALTQLQLGTMQGPDNTEVIGYRWVHEDYREALHAESEARGVSRDEFDTNMRYHDTHCMEDILEKCRCILAGKPWDHTVVMSFDIEDELREQVLAAASHMGITENEFYVRAFKAAVDGSLFEQ